MNDNGATRVTVSPDADVTRTDPSGSPRGVPCSRPPPRDRRERWVQDLVAQLVTESVGGEVHAPMREAVVRAVAHLVRDAVVIARLLMWGLSGALLLGAYKLAMQPQIHVPGDHTSVTAVALGVFGWVAAKVRLPKRLKRLFSRQG